MKFFLSLHPSFISFIMIPTFFFCSFEKKKIIFHFNMPEQLLFDWQLVISSKQTNKLKTFSVLKELIISSLPTAINIHTDCEHIHCDDWYIHQQHVVIAKMKWKIELKIDWFINKKEIHFKLMKIWCFVVVVVFLIIMMMIEGVNLNDDRSFFCFYLWLLSLLLLLVMIECEFSTNTPNKQNKKFFIKIVCNKISNEFN